MPPIALYSSREGHIGIMSERENVGLVQQTYSAFSRQDTETILGMFSEDATMKGPAPADKLPWGGVYHGRQGVVQFFKSLGESLEVSLFEPREFIAQGKRVVVLGFQRGRAKPTGQPYETEFAHVFTLQGGKIVEFQSFADMLSLAESLQKTIVSPEIS